MAKRRLVVEASGDYLWPWTVSEVDEDGTITGKVGDYGTVDEAMAKWPEVKWSERIPAEWKPDVVRVGPWYEDEGLAV